MLSQRRVWAAGIGAYVGITASALAVGIQLGIEPMLFTQNGHALYSPYGLDAAIPAMLIAHALGASIVEALITAFGVAWIQSRHPEYLTGSVADDFEVRTAGDAAAAAAAADADAEPSAPPRPLWQTAAVLVAVSRGTDRDRRPRHRRRRPGARVRHRLGGGVLGERGARCCSSSASSLPSWSRSPGSCCRGASAASGPPSPQPPSSRRSG